MKLDQWTRRRHWVTGTGVSLVLLQACASYQRPERVAAQMARTEAVLEHAQSNGAHEKALPEFQHARDKFAEAQVAYEKRTESGDRTARQLAREAEVDANFAVAKTQAERQGEAAREVRQSVDALADEAQRKTPVPPPITTPY